MDRKNNAIVACCELETKSQATSSVDLMVLKHPTSRE